MASENEVAIHVTSKNDTSTGFSDVKKSTADVTSGFERAGEAADGAEGKAQGFSDTLTGTADVMAGTSQIAKGDLFGGFVTLGQGMADLAGGMASFLIPAMQNMTLSSIKARAANIAHAAATRALTIAQKGLNLAMRMNPIGLVITAIVLLAGAFIMLWRRSETFRNFWIGLWSRIKEVASSAKDRVVGVWNGALDFFRGLPKKIGSALGGLARILTTPYRLAFNAIKSLWNSTVGGFGFSVPDWIPGVGGKSFTIPNMARGGIRGGLTWVGEAGRELVRLPHGSQVIPHGQSEAMAGAGRGGFLGTIEVVIKNEDGREIQRKLLALQRTDGALGLV